MPSKSTRKLSKSGRSRSRSHSRRSTSRSLSPSNLLSIRGHQRGVDHYNDEKEREHDNNQRDYSSLKSSRRPPPTTHVVPLLAPATPRGRSSSLTRDALKDQLANLERKTALLKLRSSERRDSFDDCMSVLTNEASLTSGDDSFRSVPLTENTYSERRKKVRRSRQKACVEKRRSGLEKQLRRVSNEQQQKEHDSPGDLSSKGTIATEPSSENSNSSNTDWESLYRSLKAKMSIEIGLLQEQLAENKDDLGEAEAELVDAQLDLAEAHSTRDRLERDNMGLRRAVRRLEKENDELQHQIIKLSGNEAALLPPAEEEEDGDDLNNSIPKLVDTPETKAKKNMWAFLAEEVVDDSPHQHQEPQPQLALGLVTPSQTRRSTSLAAFFLKTRDEEANLSGSIFETPNNPITKHRHDSAPAGFAFHDSGSTIG